MKKNILIANLIENYIIYFGSIICDKEKKIKEIEELKHKIIKLEDSIKNIINILNKVVENMKIYYKINLDIINKYEIKNRNYQILTNVNYNNNDILFDIDKIISCKYERKIFNDLIQIYEKMFIKNNQNEIVNRKYNNIMNEIDYYKNNLNMRNDYYKRNENCINNYNKKNENIINEIYNIINQNIRYDINFRNESIRNDYNIINGNIRTNINFRNENNRNVYNIRNENIGSDYNLRNEKNYNIKKQNIDKNYNIKSQ